MAKHVLPELPFAKNALEPFMSAETLEYHHGKHHKAYVDKLNELIPGTEFENMALEEIMMNSGGPIFNNAAQVWNHTFFWHCLTPPSKVRNPQGELMSALNRDFASFETFMQQFQKAALGQFGSGWAWLVRDDRSKKLSIETTPNAENPLRAGKKPILTCDVWEHAYYIDYRNARAKFLEAVPKVINWEFVEKNYAQVWNLVA